MGMASRGRIGDISLALRLIRRWDCHWLYHSLTLRGNQRIAGDALAVVVAAN